MTATTLSGTRLAAEIKAEVLAAAESLARRGVEDHLGRRRGDRRRIDTFWYVRSIATAAKKTGITCRVVDLGAGATEGQIADQLDELSSDPAVHGIILQTPLPAGVPTAGLVGRHRPCKDVDGANPVSLGRLAVGQPAFAPATARSVVDLLAHHKIPVSGRMSRSSAGPTSSASRCCTCCCSATRP